MKKWICAAALAWVLAAALPSLAQAALTTFQFSYSGAPFGNGAQATGAVTLDLALIDYITGPDGQAPVITLPSPAVADITMTVAGASAGNGTFGLKHFYSFWFSSPYPLDLSRELIGQPLANGYAFGPTDSACSKGNGPCGDFNFDVWRDFPEGVPPEGVDFFQVVTEGGERMLLTSLAPRAVPEPGSLALAGLALTCLAALRRRKEWRQLLRLRRTVRPAAPRTSPSSHSRP